MQSSASPLRSPTSSYPTLTSPWLPLQNTGSLPLNIDTLLAMPDTLDLNTLERQNAQLFALLQNLSQNGTLPTIGRPSSKDDESVNGNMTSGTLDGTIIESWPRPDHGDTSDEFDDPLPEDKKERRRELNRRASMRRRKRQMEELVGLRERDKVLTLEVQGLRQEVMRLKQDMQSLMQENLILRANQV